MPKIVEIWPQLPTGVVSVLQRLTEALVTVCSKQQLFKWQFTPQQASLVATTAAKLVQILGRECYSEQHKQYPVLSGSALKAVLAQEFRGLSVLHRVGPIQNGQQQVTTYSLTPMLTEKLKTGFWLPETLLLGSALPGEVLAVQDSAQNFFCCHWNGQSYSALQTAICADANRFKMVQGLPADLPVRQLSKVEHQLLLLRGLTALPLQSYAGFWRMRQAAMSFNWRAILITALIGWSAYLALVSGWLHWQNDHIQQQTEAMGPKVNELLDLQKQYETSRALQQEIADSLQQAIYPEQLSLLMLSLTSQQVTIERLQVKGGAAELTARAAKATSALNAIQQMPFVASASYINATRRVGEQEQFTVSLQFKSGATSHDK